MKKIYQILILLISLLYIYSESCEEINVSKKSTCHDKTVESSGEFCCYIKSKYNGETATGCISLLKENKDNIKDFIKEMEKQGGKVKSLDCKSSFIEVGLFSLIFLLL